MYQPIYTVVVSSSSSSFFKNTYIHTQSGTVYLINAKSTLNAWVWVLSKTPSNLDPEKQLDAVKNLELDS